MTLAYLDTVAILVYLDLVAIAAFPGTAVNLVSADFLVSLGLVATLESLEPAAFQVTLA